MYAASPMTLKWRISSTVFVIIIICMVMKSVVKPVTGQLLVDLFRDVETSLLNTRLPDTYDFRTIYDFVIIGAGSGGAVVANRLSEIHNISVLLLEAGDQETFLSDVPLTAALTSITRYNWGYKSEPTANACQGLVNGRCNWPKGKGVGGTSLINFMLYNRGDKSDYNYWNDTGNSGWSYDDVLPYFKKSENIGIPELRTSFYHGKEGPLDVQYSPYRSKLLNAFLRAGKELGYSVSDPNGEQMRGFSPVQATMRNGRRCSTSKAFVRPIINRRNFHISMKSFVTKIIIDPNTKRATGVQFVKGNKNYVIRVRKEVILCAGAISSPQLLMLSGIGPREHLEELGIEVIADLKVGYNLQDHVSLPGLTFLANQPVSVIESEMRNPFDVFDYIINSRGKFTIPGGAEGFAFIRTPNSTFGKDYTNMEIVLGSGSLNNDISGSMRALLGIPDEFFEKVYKGIIGKHAFGLVPVLLQPKSRGRISLFSRNPFRWPKMEPNFMDHHEDIESMIEGIQFILKLSNSRHFQMLGSKFHRTPYLGCENEAFASDDYWRCCLRRFGTSLQHQSGTCKMGPQDDPDAVVNPNLQVYGIQGLRVVDASIIPRIPAGHTNAIVIMIAEKASDMIKQYWNL